MKYKKGVIIHQCWQFEHFKYAADKVWQELFGHEALLTSAMDSTHSDESLHYQGLAWDLRIRRKNDINQKVFIMSDLIEAKDMLKEILGKEYDVVIESTHIHIEFDPK